MKMCRDYKIIDFHSHILPSADHGSDGLDTSLAQLSLMKKAGIEIAVSTTHFYPQYDTVEGFLEKRENAAQLLKANKSDDVSVALGAEVYAVAGIENLKGLENLTIKGTNTLLLEMPSTFWNTNIIDTVFALDERFDLVIAHIDRYHTNSLDKLLYVGIRAQINAGNILNYHNKRRLQEWLSGDNVWALGSDIHMADKKAMKSFVKAQKLLKDYNEEIFGRSESLIKNAELI